MLPIRLASVELFTLMKNLDLLDSLTGLILVYTAIRIPFAVFIFANFMRVLPSRAGGGGADATAPARRASCSR